MTMPRWLTLAMGLCALTALAQETPPPKAPAAPPAQEGDQPEVKIAVERIHHQPATDEAELEFYALGSTNLPNGARLRLEVRLDNGRPARFFGQVTDGTWRCDLVQRGRFLLPGVYRVDVSFYAEDQTVRIGRYVDGGFRLQTGSQTLTVGDPEKAPVERARVRQRLLEILTIQGRAYRALADWFSYTKEATQAAVLEAKGKLSEPEKRRILRLAANFSRDVWAEVYPRTMHEYAQFRAELALLPYPEVEDHFEAFPALFDRGYGFCIRVLFHMVDEPAPPQLPDPGDLSWDEIRKVIDDHAQAIIKALEAPDFDWGLVDLVRLEQGFVDQHTYLSKVSKFRIDRPKEGWLFMEARFDPAVRIRIRPQSDERHNQGVAGVEIKDFPSADNKEDLAKQLLMTIERRWTGYKKISEKALEVTDETMPNGVRFGLETVFTAEQEGKKFKILEYDLFCRYLKRSYGVICLADFDQFKSFEAEFRQITKSFAILDDPNLDFTALWESLRKKGAIPFSGGIVDPQGKVEKGEGQ